MISSVSRDTLGFPHEALDFAFDPRVLGVEGFFDARRPPLPVGHHANVGPAQFEASSDPAEDVASELRSVGRGIHIMSAEKGNRVPRNVVHRARRKVKDAYISVNKNVGKLSRQERLAIIAQKIKELRKSRGMKQGPLAGICGVSRVQISRWEHGLDLPSAAAMLKISELVPDAERQWWRDQAAGQVGIDANRGSTFDTFAAPNPLRTIPLLKDSKMVGTVGTIHSVDIEQSFQLPANWFPEGGSIQAARIEAGSITTLAEGGCIALIDVSRRDPDRLVDCIVAVQTPTGITARRLRRDGRTYILTPLRESSGHSASILRLHGENSIVGQIVKWVGDAASPPSQQPARKGKRER